MRWELGGDGRKAERRALSSRRVRPSSHARRGAGGSRLSAWLSPPLLLSRPPPGRPQHDSTLCSLATNHSVVITTTVIHLFSSSSLTLFPRRLATLCPLHRSGVARSKEVHRLYASSIQSSRSPRPQRSRPGFLRSASMLSPRPRKQPRPFIHLPHQRPPRPSFSPNDRITRTSPFGTPSPPLSSLSTSRLHIRSSPPYNAQTPARPSFTRLPNKSCGF